MNDTSQEGKKKRITYTATDKGIERAEKALERDFGSKTNFANYSLVSRSTITKFFSQKAIQFDCFQQICEELKLSDWREISGIKQAETLKVKQIDHPISNYPNEGRESMPNSTRQITVIDEPKNTVIAVITLQGDINSAPNKEIFETILREHSGRTIKIIDQKKGSIKLFVEGSSEDIKQIVSLIKSKKITELSGFPVEEIQIVDESFYAEETTEPNNKWNLVKDIVNQRVDSRSLTDADLSGVNLRGAHLRDADLSRADLRGADLRGADLRGADLSETKIDKKTKLDSKWRKVWEIVNQGAKNQNLTGADLILANLRGADLRGANLRDAHLSAAHLSAAHLRGANLRDAHLRGANLRGANLRGADLRGADLRGADLSETKIDKKTKLDSKWRKVWEIVNQGAKNQNLTGADLILANLILANLRGADLRGADLILANLILANLRGADLRGADLRGADLRGADLRGADLSGTKVEKTRFLSASGISGSLRRYLIDRGAIFDDFPGDRSEILA